MQQVVASVKATLDFIPDPQNTNIGVITYSNVVQFFVCSGGEPNIVVMGDVNNPFSAVPKPKLLNNLKEGREQIEAILDKAASCFENLGNYRSPLAATGSCAGAALRSAINLLNADSGRILWFLMDIPSCGYGALKSRNSRALYNTEKESSMLVPDDKVKAYSDMAEFCVHERIGVDVFACTQGDVDLATIAPVAGMTGGEVYYYPVFNSADAGEKLHFDVFRNLTRTTVYDVSIRARASIGLNIEKYYGGFGEADHAPIQLSVMDADKTISFGLRQTSKLAPDSRAYLQLAILYTTIQKERKIRILNYTFAVTDQVSQLYSSIDMDAVLGLEIRQTASILQKMTLNNARNKLCQTCTNVLAHYRKTVSKTVASAQFVLPESMKAYPLLVLGLLKTPAYGFTECFRLDNKVANIVQLMQGSFSYALMKVYPKLYSVARIVDPSQDSGTMIVNEQDQTASGSVMKPLNIACSAEKISPNDIYILANSDFIYIYLPKDVSETLLGEVFGKSTLAEIVPEEGLPVLESEGNVRVRNVIEGLRKERAGAYQQVKVLLHSSAQAPSLLKELLVEDSRNPKTEFSYLNFLTHIHKMVLNKLQSF